MNKPFFTLTVFLLFNSLALMAQTTDVVTEISGPSGLEFHGDELYITNNGPRSISKIDITDTNPVVTEVVSGLSTGPFYLLIVGNDLYFSLSSGGGSVSKIDLTEDNPTVTEIIGGLGQPSGLALHGDNLYIARESSNKISKINITDANPVATEVVSGLSAPVDLQIEGDDLYIAEWFGDRISKIDVTENNPTITEIVSVNRPYFFALDGMDLYFSEFGNNRVAKIDLSETTPTTTEVLTGIGGVRGLAIKESDLYIADATFSRIVKFDLSTLSVDGVTPANALSLYPNPTSGSIEISGLTKREPYKIYNLLGTELHSGTVEEQEKIDVGQLNTGVYFMRLESGKTFKFVKE